jgi:hypothetical protein
MSAEIIPFPKKIKLQRTKSVDLYHCWDRRLDNPLLNSLFKTEVSFVERWYLQTVHLLNMEQVNHPLIQALMSTEDATLDLLIELIEKDLAIQKDCTNSDTTLTTDYNLIRLNKWLVKFRGLQQYRRRLYSF